MWNNAASLNRLTAGIVLAVLGWGLYLGGSQALESWLPFRHVDVVGASRPEVKEAAPRILQRLRGGFFSLDLEAVRRAFEALPWVRQATVRRLWPDRLVVELTEHVPAASWNGLAVMSTLGEIYPARPWPGLPRVEAPEGMEREVSRRFGEFAALLGPSGWRIESLRMDASHAWRIGLKNGPTLELGRDRLDERLRRFVTFYPLAVAQLGAIPRVDLRYPNGFAAGLPVAQASKT